MELRNIYGITTLSPHYSRANGLVERVEGIAKNMFKKCDNDGSHKLIALLNFRNTPNPAGYFSPAQLLMSRDLRSKIPTCSENLTRLVGDRIEKFTHIIVVCMYCVKYTHFIRTATSLILYTMVGMRIRVRVRYTNNVQKVKKDIKLKPETENP